MRKDVETLEQRLVVRIGRMMTLGVGLIVALLTVFQFVLN
ncbi:hypothetical protein SPONL_191 [uncultured Candidatus Thioglobus sp.]|nr:hypothetical protein SPONL_191 [uncultured Candidatus Thioglobus sp.]